MYPQFDDVDKGIIIERKRIYAKKEGPRIGDFVEFPDGRRARFTHDWDDALQTTTPSDTGEGGRFYFGSGYCSYSGSLDPSIPKIDLKLVDNFGPEGSVWIFHHDRQEAHNGVDTTIQFRLYKYYPGLGEYLRKPGGKRKYILAPGAFHGSVRSSAFECNNGEFRVDHHVGEEYMGCKLNQKLDDYLKDNPDVVIVSEEELDDLLEAHYNGLKSEPEEITEERFMDMLEVLPPCKWRNMSGVEWFHVSEHLTGPLVSWFLRVGDKYYEFVDDCSLSSEQLMEKVNKLSEV